jgi:hypothetical protein
MFSGACALGVDVSVDAGVGVACPGGDDDAVLEPSKRKALFPASIEADAAFGCMFSSLQTLPFRHCHVTFRDFASSSWIFRNRTRATAQLMNREQRECTDECSSAWWL